VDKMKTMDTKKIWSDIKSKYSIFLVLIALIVVSWMANENFLSVNNLSNVSRQISVVTILAF